MVDPRQKSITTVEEWDDTPSDPPPVYGSGILEEKRRQTDYKNAYPRNEGWRPKGQKGKTENGRPRKLSDITIHGITDHLTKRITRKIKPNCIRNWKKRVRFRIDFKKVFSSFGTPLSNDAEEAVEKVRPQSD